jgi:hypothetical protein
MGSSSARAPPVPIETVIRLNVDLSTQDLRTATYTWPNE